MDEPLRLIEKKHTDVINYWVRSWYKSRSETKILNSWITEFTKLIVLYSEPLMRWCSKFKSKKFTLTVDDNHNFAEHTDNKGSYGLVLTDKTINSGIHHFKVKIYRFKRIFTNVLNRTSCSLLVGLARFDSDSMSELLHNMERPISGYRICLDQGLDTIENANNVNLDSENNILDIYINFDPDNNFMFYAINNLSGKNILDNYSTKKEKAVLNQDYRFGFSSLYGGNYVELLEYDNCTIDITKQTTGKPLVL